MCTGKASRRQELNLGKVNDGLGVIVGLHRIVRNGVLSAVRVHVDVRCLPDGRSVQEVDGLVGATHGQVPADVEGLVHGIGAVVPLDVQHLLDVLYR